MGWSNRRINTKQSCSIRHIRKCRIWHTLPRTTIQTWILLRLAALSFQHKGPVLAVRAGIHSFTSYSFCAASQVETDQIFHFCRGGRNGSQCNNNNSFSKRVGQFAKHRSSFLKADKPQPPPQLDTCSFECGTVKWWQIQQRQTPDHPAAQTASQCNQWQGSLRLQEDGKCPCVVALINREREENPVQGLSLTWKGW